VDANGTASDGDLLHQAEIYREVVQACLHPRPLNARRFRLEIHRQILMNRIAFSRDGCGSPFDRAYKPKAAFRSCSRDLRQKLPASLGLGPTIRRDIAYYWRRRTNEAPAYADASIMTWKSWQLEILP
jgi:hypothetical protein